MNDANDDRSNSESLERIPSGIAGLDAILRGGFFRGGVYMFLGKPGAGKTILGNQICFRHVASGGRSLFVTLLAESHARMVAQMRNLDFFEPSCVGTTLSYVTGYHTLEQDKLKGLLVLLRKLIRDHKATLLVIDGLVTARMMAESDIEMKKFIHELQALAELVGCTTVLLTGVGEGAEEYAQRTMVDGLVELHFDTVGMEAARTIEVTKFRGSGFLTGRHLFEISDAGATIYPRIEALYGKARERSDTTRAPLATFGIDALDLMVGGGLRAATTTMVLGPPGSAKTLLGLSFLDAGAKKLREPGLYFGFFETRADLFRKAQGIGVGLAAHVKSGLVDVMWMSPLDAIADALAQRVLATVTERGIKRLFIDGLGGFKDSLVYPERAGRFLVALCNELRTLGVTTILSDETPVQTPVQGMMAMLDNVVSLRHVELRARVHRFISVTKIREGAGDSSLHEFSIDADGIHVSATSESAEKILSGVARIDPANRERSSPRTKRNTKNRRRRAK